MRSELRAACVLFVTLSLITGGLYPLFVTLVAQTAFPSQANGSVIERDGRAVGSELIGQSFTSPGYFWGRPSATSPAPYNGAASSGSNLAASNPKLLEDVKARMARLRAADPDNRSAVPVDLVTSSASGLDPHISVASARHQVARVARARGLDPQVLERLVENQIEPRTWGLLGEPRVNVLRLNLALDAL